MTAMQDARVAIVGLGLMGGSLAGALKTRDACREVFGITRRAETAELALELGLVHRASTELASGIAQADIVVLATPVRTIIELLPQVGRLAKSGCLVMDTGSTKAAILQAMSDLPRHVHPVGGHPMCGKETSGLTVAEPDLYQGKLFVLTPLDRSGAEALSLAKELVRSIGARPLELEAERHDRLVAAISHLPYLVACALVGSAEALAQEQENLWQLAATGFLDTSRLAASDVNMMLDILLTNRGPVLEQLGSYEAQLHNLARLVETADEKGLRTALHRISACRRGVFA